MEKYKDFMANRYYVWQFVIAVLITALVVMLLIYASKQQLPTDELGEYNEKLELLKQDFSNITKMENATIEVRKSDVVVEFNGVYSSFKSFFDTEGNYIRSETIDQRLTSNFGLCFCMFCFSFIVAYVLTYVIKLVLYIPIGIDMLVNKLHKVE